MRSRDKLFVTDKTGDFLSVTTSLSNDVYQVFAEHARKAGKSRSEIMRELIVRYLKEQRDDGSSSPRVSPSS